MSLPRYRDYRSTGDSMIPVLPAEWSVSPLRNLGRFLKGRGGSKQDASESGIPCIRYGELYTTFSHSIKAPRGFVPIELASEYEPISKGDVLFAASGEDMADIGRSAVNLLDGPTVCGGDLVILRPTADVLPEFLGFACDSSNAKAQKAMMGRGTTVKHIYPDELRQVVIALPPRNQQEGVVRFLEKETAKIDALIAEQERLIALLQEKRQAVISHAVTKGLDPNVPMKDSGVEWIGDVPAHWEVRPLKHLTSFTTGWTPPTGREEYYGGEHFWANISDLGPKHLHSTEKTVTDVAVREARLKVVPRGSLLFSFKLSVGQVSLTAAEMYTNEAIAAFVPSKRMDTHYLYWAAPLLLPKNAQENIYGAPLLSRERIANAPVLYLPLEEQYSIASFLDRETAIVDALIADAASVIALLQERRTALITAAVTGQIDVRGLVEAA